MSTAEAETIILWREPTKASALRVAGRGGLALLWLALALRLPWAPLDAVLFVLAAVATAHTALAVANLARNRGVLLRLLPSGVIEWPRSLQEVALRRRADAVDGDRIEVVLEADHPAISWSDPRVSLRGATSRIGFLPLHGTNIDAFIERVNEATAPHGITLVRVDVLAPLSDDVDGRADDAEAERGGRADDADGEAE